ncbi:MAG: threonine synthase [Elusimicrobia bacterium]|nr:threonine synthase [Elusimicrobiota bacterium]
MGQAVSLKCGSCGRVHKPAETKYTCLSCGGNVQLEYDYAALRGKLTRESLAKNPERGVARYLDLLPVAKKESLPPLQIGWTPLYNCPALAKLGGVKAAYVKDDGRNPSCSFKDRAGAVALARALETGEKIITAASTGNAASSMACLAASLGVKTIIFVPKTAPAAKITQLLVFGATVITVDGTYDDAFNLCIEASKEYGWYNRNTGYNPYTREGKKTVSFELCEQLATVPDVVFVPVGDGNIISGVWKGFVEFHKLGLIDRLPRLAAVQAEGSAAIKNAFEGDGKIKPVSGDTVADSISVSIPRDGHIAVNAIKESGGFAVSVPDADILKAIPALARASGVFAEPAAAASYAGFAAAAKQGRLKASDTAVLLVTGNGLKDINSAMKSVGAPHLIKPALSELKKLVSQQKIA